MKKVALIAVSVLSLGFVLSGTVKLQAQTDTQLNQTTLSGQANSAIVETASDLLAIASPAKDKEKLCLNGRPYHGCCSSHGGIGKISVSGLTVMCNDGEESPSCSTHLRGCCSGNEGVGSVESDGTVMCNNGRPSRSCHCDRGAS